MPSNAEIRRDWSAYVGSRDITQDTRCRQIRYVDDWLTWLGLRRKNALDATPQDGLAFWSETKPGYAVSTLQPRWTALRGFYKWLQIYHVCRDPFAGIPGPRKRDPAPRPIVDAAELVELVVGWTPHTWYDHRDQAMIAALVSTGCRVSEACWMDVPDFAPRRHALSIRKGKGGKVRWGALLPAASEIVGEYIANVRPIKAAPRVQALWLNNKGTRVQPESARAMVRRTCERIGIDVHLTPHGIRASAITALYNAGADLLGCKDYAGHENASTTDKHYIRRQPNRVNEIADQFHPLKDIAAAKDDEDDPDEEAPQ